VAGFAINYAGKASAASMIVTCPSCDAKYRVEPAALEARGVRYLKGDWTRRDSEITAYLESFGRSGVPLYVLYPGPGREPIVLPQLLTVEIVQQALNNI
jgi:thiol:disulfide interchange protein